MILDHLPSNLKYLSIGLVIGLIVTGLFLAGLFFALPKNSPLATYLPFATDSPTPAPPTSTPTITPTNTDTPSPTAALTSSPTLTPMPTNTPTVPESMILNGKLLITGPLTREQQIKLYETSIQFIARTTRESKQVGEEINGIGYGSPTLICGPLSLAILQGANLIDYEAVIPYDFWLLNPYIPKDRTLVKQVFPANKYEDTRFKTPLNKFDWATYPLQPGDFIYIDRGTGGNFDHMLVVNRVDSQMRAYAVTNFGTPDGYIIDEVMLYDPIDPNAGIFHTWTEKQFSQLGSTGFGGFEVWRLRTP
ncbi:MAG: hypothetical protein JW963_03055 [Anaerolineales bacterium]|nr:hypothetical protein [Anaerolineales bacterium]